MQRPVLCAPLGVEYAALRPAEPAMHLMRTGMGQRRAAAASLPPGARAVAGLAGGLAPEVKPGDVVVADEVSGNGKRVPIPAAPMVAGALRRLGLTVHIGRIESASRIVTGDDRAALARDGALAVDLESADLATGSEAPLVVRAIVDTATESLWRLGTIRRGGIALRSLRTAVPALQQWAAATGARDVVLAGPRSFCAGVVRAIDVVDRALDRYGPPVYVRKQIVHNAHVVRRMTDRGAIFVDEVDEVPDRARLVFSAHGVSPEVRRAAEERELNVIDATCPLVTKVHTEVRRFARRGDTVFLIGHPDHEEVEGTRGEAPAEVIVVDDAEAARTVSPRDPERVAYAMQTTLAVDESEEIAAILRERFPALRGPSQDDICYATTNRQDAVREVARQSELVLVVGSANSSNSRRLVEVAEREGAAAHLVDDASEVDLRWLAGVTRVGLTAGASAPPELVDDMVHCLSGLGPITVDEVRLADEDVTFKLPKELG